MGPVHPERFVGAAKKKKERTSFASREIRWVVKPRQGRSQEKLDRILDAAERIIAKKGFERASVSQIMREANCSVGLFYSRFRNKDELLRFLFERFLGEVSDTAREILNHQRWEDRNNPRELLEVLVRGTVALYQEKRGMIVAFHQAVMRDPALAARAMEVALELGSLASWPLGGKTAPAKARPIPALQFAIGAAMAILNERAYWEQAFHIDLADDEFVVREMVKMLEGYLAKSL